MKKALVILCVFVIIFSFSACEPQSQVKETENKSSYEDAIKRYEKIYNGDFQKIRYTAPEKAWKFYEKETGRIIDDVILEAKTTYETFKNEINEEYGTDFYITLSITKSEHCNAETLEKIAKTLHTDYEISENNVADAYKITMSATVTAGDDFEAGDSEYYMVQIENEWYLITYYDFGDEGIVGFAFI